MRPVSHRLLERALRVGRVVRLEVKGGCMHPLIRSGDSAIVRRSAPVVAGQVALARNQTGDLVCHRVLDVRAEGLLLAGDRASRPELHPTGTVLGRVVGVERRGSKRAIELGRHRWLDQLAARLHLIAHNRRERPTGRLLDALRRRCFVWAATLIP